MTEEIIWKDPPPARAHNNIWVQRLAPLLKQPNRWALVATTRSSATAHALRKGMYKIPEGKWEFRHHGTPNGSQVYARYLGPTGEGE